MREIAAATIRNTSLWGYEPVRAKADEPALLIGR